MSNTDNQRQPTIGEFLFDRKKVFERSAAVYTDLENAVLELFNQKSALEKKVSELETELVTLRSVKNDVADTKN